MSTVAFRALLVREIEQAMKRVHPYPGGSRNFQEGQLDAYAHVLTLIGDMEGE